MRELSSFPTDRAKRSFIREIMGLGLSAVVLRFWGATEAGATINDTQRKAVMLGRYNPAQDIFYLNKALGREHDVILSYDFSIETGLLEKTAMSMFNMVQTDHFIHRDKLIAAVTRLGGKPVETKSRDEFNKEFNTELIRTGTDALRFNKRFESECFVNFAEISTYLRDPSLASMAATFSAEELQHKAMLVTAIGSVPYDYSLRVRD